MDENELIEKYLGLWEEFRNWYVETSLANNEPSKWQRDDEIASRFKGFMRGDVGFVFFDHDDLLPPPQHVIAMRRHEPAMNPLTPLKPSFRMEGSLKIHRHLLIGTGGARLYGEPVLYIPPWDNFVKRVSDSLLESMSHYQGTPSPDNLVCDYTQRYLQDSMFEPIKEVIETTGRYVIPELTEECRKIAPGCEVEISDIDEISGGGDNYITGIILITNVLSPSIRAMSLI